MGWKEFVASIYATTLSWPVAIVVVVVIFYRPLRQLIGDVESGKTPWFEFKTRRDLEVAGALARDAEVNAKKTLTDSDEADDGVTDALGTPERRPRRAATNNDLLGRTIRASHANEGRMRFTDYLEAQAIEEPVRQVEWAWNKLAGSVLDLYEKRGGKQEEGMSPLRAALALRMAGVLDYAFLDSLQGLESVKQDVQYRGHASERVAREFINTAFRLRGILESQAEAGRAPQG